jgi:oligoribonuclease NrnB/cAMP/cGMP phosphodiesterase (DHH superfamily)
MHKYLIIYHGNCYDGFTSAWIANRFLQGPESDITFYSGVFGNDPPWEEIKQADSVFILDFSYPREQMIKIGQMLKIGGTFQVLDHHVSAQKDCEGLDFCHFDIEHSGAGLAWEYFSSVYSKKQTVNDLENIVMPHWIECVEDRDLWQFNYGGTKAFHAYMASYEMTFENWDNFHYWPMAVMIERGEHILRYTQQQVKLLADEMDFMVLKEHRLGIVNAPLTFASETCHEILQRVDRIDYAMAWFQKSDSKFQYSLRSEGDFDVSEIAKIYGGGGHKNASGFSQTVGPWYLKNVA